MLLDLALPRLRRVAMRNLAMALPQTDPRSRTRIVDGVFRSIARLLVTFARFPRMDRRNVSRGSGMKASNISSMRSAAARACFLRRRTWATGN